MKTLTIGFYQGKPIKKLVYEANELEHIQPYVTKDVFFGNPLSNIALGCIPGHLQGAQKKDYDELSYLSNYCAVAGFWSTTNGGKYVFANILANPNINKLVLYCSKRDNTHFLLDACINFWKYGVGPKGIIPHAKAMNPKFEGISPLELERVRNQVDLVVLRNVTSLEQVEAVVKACYQEPEHAVKKDHLEKTINLPLELYPEQPLFDGGIRYDKPYYVDKDYIFESDLYHFETPAHFLEHFPKAIFSQGVMQAFSSTDLSGQLPPCVASQPGSWHTFIKSFVGAFSPTAVYTSTLPLAVVKINNPGTRKKKNLFEGLVSTHYSYQDFSVYVFNPLCFGTFSISGALLKKQPLLTPILQASDRLFLVFPHACVFVVETQPSSLSKKKPKS